MDTKQSIGKQSGMCDAGKPISKIQLSWQTKNNNAIKSLHVF